MQGLHYSVKSLYMLKVYVVAPCWELTDSESAFLKGATVCKPFHLHSFPKKPSVDFYPLC